MSHTALPLDRILEGDCIEVLASIPAESVDLIFADPPYNLQLRQELYRPNRTLVDAVDDDWDRFGSFEEYDAFTRAWLTACRRVLKNTGTIWVIGTYHNIYRLGAILQDLGYWILNDVIWVKTNPMPNFRGVRFTNAHETLIWAAKAQGCRYTFNHHTLKTYNGGKQMRSDWRLPICSGGERLKAKGRKAHSTQKPEALLERVIVAASRPGDVVLDPFLGSGTTAAVAKRLHRHWIGIEKEPQYVAIATERLASVTPAEAENIQLHPRDETRARRRIRFEDLLPLGLVGPGEVLYFRADPQCHAVITDRGTLRMEGFEGSIHQAATHLSHGVRCNGWECWYYVTANGAMRPIDDLRKLAEADCGL